ncbi:MAG: CRISPR system precrRNA processing endoribonuclease RAMP protein Cas6 [Desulfobacterota bacterium]|nr:CRISPR system precrRNA processing endoribonuclease RAMP protein Cas6 [Thermodesulfobacteriota bacterium]
MEGLFEHFRFARFEFLLKATDEIHLPTYKGSTFRGAFGHTFKKIVCINREKDCNGCLLKNRCIYSYVFETPPPPDTEKMKKYPYAPHPFVITPPLETTRTYKEGEGLKFELTLIGKAIDYLPYFIYTFDELGKKGIGKGQGTFQLEKVKAVGGAETEEEGSTVYSSVDKALRCDFKVLDGRALAPLDLDVPTLTLQFLTPTRLKFDGALTLKLEFHILVRNLLRRISLLSYFHCGEELVVDFKGLIEKSKEVRIQKETLRWVDWERYSNRQETRMKMGGFIGPITFMGDFKPYAPFLLLGEQIHVGKGTSFGLGKFKISKQGS